MDSQWLSGVGQLIVGTIVRLAAIGAAVGLVAYAIARAIQGINP